MAATTIGTLIVTVTLATLVLFLSANFVPYVQIGLGVSKQTFGEVAWSYTYRAILECSVLAVEGFWKTGDPYTCRAVMSLSNPASVRIEGGSLVFSTPSGKTAVDLGNLRRMIANITGYPYTAVSIDVVERGTTRIAVEATASQDSLRIVIAPG